jgi:hypothetical protein
MDQRDGFGFLTNHGRALLCLSRHPAARMRDVAGWLGITERAVQRIVADLEAAGYLRRARQGRRNVYEVDAALPLRHPSEGARTVGALLGLAQHASEPPPLRAPARGELSFLD